MQEQDRLVWSLWKESHGQFSVVHKMWKLGSWQMCKNKKGVTTRLAMLLFAQNVEE